MNQELSVARAHGLACIEVGGWAIDPSVRGGLDALRTVLFTFAWCIAAGGCVGLSVATLRNGSAAILQRVGGRPLECDGQALPPYFDARYGCEMVALRFDSQHLSPKYRHVVEAMHADMQKVPVVSAVSSSPPRREVRAQIALPAGVFRQAIAPLAALSTGLTDAAS